MNFSFFRNPPRRQDFRDLQFAVENLESRLMLSTIQVIAAGTTGTEVIELQIAGATVASYSDLGSGADTGQFQSRTFVTAPIVPADNVRVRFTNDLVDSNGLDRNVRIDAVIIDGIRYETESPTVFSTGTWLPGDGVQPGFRQSEYLHANGYFQYSGGTGVTTPIVVNARGSEGNESFALQINGQTVRTWDNINTSFSSYSYTAAGSVTADQIRVVFLNDQWDPDNGVDANLIVDDIVVGGVQYETESANVFSNGTWRSEDGIQPGFGRGDTLHVNGYFQFSSGNGSTIDILARGDAGGERFQLIVDGNVVQNYAVDTSFRNFTYITNNLVTADQVRIEFINDQYNPDAGIDSNLTVDFVRIDGVTYQSEATSTFSTGTWRPEDGITPGFGRGETLNSNGFFQYLAGDSNPSQRIQAESGTTFGPQAKFEDVHDNFDGTGFIGFLINQGDGVEMNVDVASAGSYDFDIRYAAGQAGPASDRTITLFVNGNQVDQLSMSRTGNWSSWHNFVQQVDLQSGNNTVRFEVLGGDTGYLNLDYIDVRTFSGRLNLGSTAFSLLGDSTTFSSTNLQVRKLATLPTFPSRGSQSTRQIINVANRSNDPDGVYTASQDGRVFRISISTGEVSFVFDVDDFIQVARQNFQHGGLRSIAFHPDFDDSSKPGYGKIYATLMADTNNPSGNYIGTSQGNVDSVVAEFNWNFAAGVGVDGFRELFRVRNPQFDHPIKDLSFNTAAQPGDLDYGLLYIAHGDGSIFSANIGNGLVTSDALGKILRINPLQSGNQPYTTPGNVFATDGDPLTLAEVYTWGHRNPHNITFGRSGSSTYLLAAEIGQDSVEEVNLIRISNSNDLGDNGRSYGWGDRTGTFEKTGFGYALGTGVESLRLDDGGREYVYPVLQLDQDDPNNNKSVAIAGGRVLNGRYFYGMFAGNSNSPGGQVYSVDVNLLLSQKTSFNASAGETTADLTFIDDNLQHRLNYDGQTYDSFAQLLSDDTGSNTFRSDFRFGNTADGRLIVTSKRNGAIYIVDNASSLPQEFA